MATIISYTKLVRKGSKFWQLEIKGEIIHLPKSRCTIFEDRNEISVSNDLLVAFDLL